MAQYKRTITAAEWHKVQNALATGLAEVDGVSLGMRQRCREAAGLMGGLAWDGDICLGRNGFANQEETVGVCVRLLRKDFEFIFAGILSGPGSRQMLPSSVIEVLSLLNEDVFERLD